MRKLLLVLALSAFPGCWPNRQVPAVPPVLLPPPTDEGLPALPERSPRNANYTIEARLDPERHTLDGTLVLEWRNTTGAPQSTFPFHLYWNAFRNTLSSSARGEDPWEPPPGEEGERAFGYVDVRSVRLLGDPETDLTPTLRFIQPDDGNRDDRTVLEATTPAPVPPDGTARFHIAWHSVIPFGDAGRAGWVHDYHFIAQWFPKVGVFWKGAWNAHQFHPSTEFFADYGTYDVRLTLPRGFVVGATGSLRDRRENPDGTETLQYVQEDVHDFTWTASRRFLEKKGRFEDPGYPPVALRLLVQPEHENLTERYLEAARIALRSYGTWSAPYPYPQLTIVDPAWQSSSGGMEYPTLITGGAGLWAPTALHSPESVTIHEAGHQFWYGLVGTNEFEEAWLDEGFNRYHDHKAANLFLGPRGLGKRYFGLTGANSSGWPVVAPGVWIGRGEDILSGLRKEGKTDVLARRGWEYRTDAAYRLNSYGKAALSLQTLEGLLGDEVMTRVIRTYARRFRFAHPTTDDFIATVNEVTGRDWRWYFDQTWFSSDLCDYAVDVRSEKPPRLEGYADGPAGRPSLAPVPEEEEEDDSDQGPFDSEVTVLRLGEVKLPVELAVEFADGRVVYESWDGQYRWTRFRYHGPAKVRRALIDPQGKIALDVSPANNSWVDEKGTARRAATKWGIRYLLWLQTFLEMHTVIG